MSQAFDTGSFDASAFEVGGGAPPEVTGARTGALVLACLIAAAHGVSGGSARGLLTSSAGAGARGVAGTSTRGLLAGREGAGYVTPPGVAGYLGTTLALTSAASGVRGVSAVSTRAMGLGGARIGVHGVSGLASTHLGMTRSGAGLRGVAGAWVTVLNLQLAASGAHQGPTISGEGTRALVLTGQAQGWHFDLDHLDLTRRLPVGCCRRVVSVSEHGAVLTVGPERRVVATAGEWRVCLVSLEQRRA